MKTFPAGFRELYASGLAAHLRRSDESPLHQAYALGRQALELGLGVLDLTELHHEALAQFLARHPQDGDDGDWLARAAEFMSEGLAPFEMSLLGYREANRKLSDANAELTRTYAAFAEAHERLKVEMEERKKAEEALVHAKKLQAVGQLAGGVAHHFNNLLTVVLGNIDLARRRIARDEQVDRMLDSARRGAERGAEVTRQLLSFSRQQMLQPRPLDPAAWLEDMRPLLASVLRGDIEIETEAARGVRTIKVDPGQLELAILNLAVNARDAMPNGGVLRISLADRRVEDGHLGLDGDYVTMEVADTGVGIDPENLPRVFEPFFSTKSGGPGAGLGLSQVHGFTHQSGGGVELEPRDGGGVIVRLYLPAADRRAAPRPDKPPTEEPAAKAGSVLVVEDDVDLARLACDLLESFGYTVKLAHRAQAALDLVSSGEPFDVVFSDVIMPGGMNGLQLAQAVRHVRPDLPVLLTSGFNDAVEDMRSKGLPFLVKPYQASQLRASIGELVGRLSGG